MIVYDASSGTLLDIRDLEEFEDDVAIRNTLLTRSALASVTRSANTFGQISYPITLCSSQPFPHICLLPIHPGITFLLPGIRKLRGTAHSLGSKSAMAERFIIQREINKQERWQCG